MPRIVCNKFTVRVYAQLRETGRRLVPMLGQIVIISE